MCDVCGCEGEGVGRECVTIPGHVPHSSTSVAIYEEEATAHLRGFLSEAALCSCPYCGFYAVWDALCMHQLGCWLAELTRSLYTMRMFRCVCVGVRKCVCVCVCARVCVYRVHTYVRTYLSNTVPLSSPFKHTNNMLPQHIKQLF